MKILVNSRDHIAWYWYLAMKDLHKETYSSWEFKEEYKEPVMKKSSSDYNVLITEHPKYIAWNHDSYKVLILSDVPRYVPWDEINKVDLVFSNSLSIVDNKKIFYLPLAVSSHLFFEEENHDTHVNQACFIGHMWSERKKFFKDLPVDIFNESWKKSRELYSKYLISINYGVFCDMDNKDGFPLMRTFEAAICGCLPFDEYRKGNPDWVIQYKDQQDLLEKLAYYTGHPEIRYLKANYAQEDVIKNHTYHNRMKVVLDKLKERGYE